MTEILYRPGLTRLKDPEAILDYSTVWTDHPSIASAIITSSPAGLTCGAPTISGNKVTTIISGGTVGTDYSVGFRITTPAGLVDERTIILRVQQR